MLRAPFPLGATKTTKQYSIPYNHSILRGFFTANCYFSSVYSTTTQTIYLNNQRFFHATCIFSSKNVCNHETILNTLQTLHTQRFFTAKCQFSSVYLTTTQTVYLNNQRFSCYVQPLSMNDYYHKTILDTLQALHTQRLFTAKC